MSTTQSRTHASRLTPHASRLFVLLGILLATTLRLGNLGRWSLWYDETVSVYLAQLPLRAMLDHTAGDIHPPGYYALLHLWQLLVQPTPAHGLEYLYGFVSVAAGVAGLALLYVIGRSIFGATPALVALWLGAINPFQIWYSQEVRMYTLGALLALLCLWATLRWFRGGGMRFLVMFALAAAAGLCTLYYFLFVLAGLGVASLILARAWRRWLLWLLANGAALLLFFPWWGVFWRQATDPPVPPWRVPWQNLADLLASVQEALAALLVGQTPMGSSWLWALATIAVTLWALLALRGQRRERWALAVFVLAPLVLILAVTAAITPLYHVRYLFPFAAPLLLFAGATTVDLWRRSRVLGALAAVVMVAGSLLSLWNGWSNPQFARDDHRGAVQTLMRGWRPGDLVLINAGWAYTPLAVYWDRGEATGWAAPPLGEMVRLLPKETAHVVLDAALSAPIVRTGSVDGDPILGWGAAESDFFAASETETMEALENLAAGGARRIWHYRIYDTVSDPNGTIRAWIDANTTLLRDIPIAGRDLGRLELRAFGEEPAQTDGIDAPIAIFGDTLALHGIDTARTDAAAGTTFYATLHLHTLGEGVTPETFAASLRLYDAAGTQVAQHDEPLVTGDPAEAIITVPLAVSTSGAPAGEYTLAVILYDAATGAALPVVTGGESIDGQQFVIGRYPVQ